MVIDEIGKKQGIARAPLHDLEIRWTSLLTNPFLHPSVMIRRAILCQHQLSYDVTFHASQDYELWTRLLEYTCGANLKDVLTVYRLSSDSITAKHREIQFRNQDLVILRTIRQQLPEFTITQEQVSQLRESFIGSIRPKRDFESQRVMLAGLYLDLLAAFAEKYQNHSDMKTLQQRETLKIVLMVFKLRFFSYWTTIVKRALYLYPDIGYYLVRHMVNKYILKRIRRSISRFFETLGLP